MTLLLDIAAPSGGIATIAAVVFFLVFVAVAFIAFRILKRTAKMAFRIAVLIVILLTAIVGSIALWALSPFNSASSNQRPPASSRR